MSKHGEVVKCVSRLEGLKNREHSVNGRIDAGNDRAGIEVELSTDPKSLVWAMSKLSKVEDGKLYVPKENLRKARKYRDRYEPEVEVRKIDERCLKT